MPGGPAPGQRGPVRAHPADAERGHRRRGVLDVHRPGPAAGRRPAQPGRRRDPAPPAHHPAPVQRLAPNFAFTWQSPSRIPLPAGMGFQHAELQAVRMSDYTTTAARPNRGFLQTARAQHVALPPMLLGTAWTLPLHPDTPARHTTTSTSSPRCSGSTPPTGKTRNATAKPATTTRRLASTPQAPSWTKSGRHARLPVPVRILAAMRTANRHRPSRPSPPQRPGHRRPSPGEPGRTGRHTAPRRARWPILHPGGRTSGTITGSYGCTRSGSGTRACSSTR